MFCRLHVLHVYIHVTRIYTCISKCVFTYVYVCVFCLFVCCFFLFCLSVCFLAGCFSTLCFSAPNQNVSHNILNALLLWFGLI